MKKEKFGLGNLWRSRNWTELGRVGWSGKDYFRVGVKGIPFNIYSPPHYGKLYFGGGRCVGTVDLWSVPGPRGVWGKNPELTIPVGRLVQYL